MKHSTERYFQHPTALVETTDIGGETKIWAYVHVMRGAVIGRRCNIGDHAFIESGAVVGDEVTIKNGVSVWAHVTIRDRVFLGPHVALTNDARPRSRRADWTPVPTVIDEGATIGANATILCGCHIGAYAMVGAGSVVTKRVPAHAIVVGNPARVTGFVCRCGASLRRRGSALACPACGLEYRKSRAGVEPRPPALRAVRVTPVRRRGRVR